MTKGVDERIDEGILRWLGHVEMMENYMIARLLLLFGEYLAAGSTPGRERQSRVKDQT